MKVPTSHIKDSNSTLSIFGIEICKDAKDYAEFCDRMEEFETEFVKSLCLEYHTLTTLHLSARAVGDVDNQIVTVADSCLNSPQLSSNSPHS